MTSHENSTMPAGVPVEEPAPHAHHSVHRADAAALDREVRHGE
ncbi:MULTISPECIES: hypothetical protein [Micrococcaceae]|nr:MULTISPECIES: hypothetical protein [Micrococcaceae]MBB5750868.1 hypothetical protein [Micrococcus sp. TA1]HRO30840.1 hypothetical protein [Citricoccus sp.]HRO92419.1 hypothetical protein [Citricoccus sp.]